MRIDLGHVGVFRALADAAGLSGDLEAVLLQLLQAKDIPGLRDLCRRLDEPFASALLGLPDLYGGPETLVAATSALPALPAITTALTTLRQLQASLPDLPLSFDLADLRGYHYHNGAVFAAYLPAFSSAVALGGRYDGVGRAFGRARPATGFSLDLRELARQATSVAPAKAILAPYAAANAAAAQAIGILRERGETVVELLPGETSSEGPLCDRRLVERSGQWVIEAINRDE